MTQTIRNLLALTGIALFSAASFAGTISVTTVADAPTTTTVPGNCTFPLMPPLCDADTTTTAEPAGCTLRKAMLFAEGQAQQGCTAVADTGEVTAVSADTIVFSNTARGTVLVSRPLPVIRNPLTIVGLGPDQTIITGDPFFLATSNPAPASGTPAPNDTRFVELAIFQVHPDLPAGAEVKLDSLSVRGARIHYFRSTAIRVDNTTSKRFTTGANEGRPNVCGANAPTAAQAIPCCGGRVDLDDASAGNFPACPTFTLEPNKSVINFAGLVMDSGGGSGARKKVTLTNTRFFCNRRGRSSETPAGHLIGFPAEFENGGALSVLGKASISMTTATFSNNISEFGSGGAVFAGAKDNGSPELTVTDNRFDADAERACTDDVVATFRDENVARGQNANQSCQTNTGSATLGQSGYDSPCPFNNAASGIADNATGTQLFTSFAPGNFAGSSIVDSAARLRRRAGAMVATRFATRPAAQSGVADGGAIAVDALGATLNNIGGVSIRRSEAASAGSRFLNNSALGDGGALSIKHVARSAADLPALDILGALFSSPGSALGTGNNAFGNGGAISILGNANQQSAVKFAVASFSFNGANNDGGALHYRTQPGAPINFSMENVRFGSNFALGDGGAIYAEDNGVDDSGVLNIVKATFDGNGAAGGGGAIYCGATKQDSQFTNITVSANTASSGGGIFVNDRCHVSINNATIFDNTGTSRGGGIAVDPSAGNGRVDVRNTILAANKTTSTANGPDCAAPNTNVLRSAGFNFVGNNSGCSTVFVPRATVVAGQTKCLNPDTGDIVGNPVTTGNSPSGVAACAAPQNPALRVLADNGGAGEANNIQGARNFTHHPETGSPVINNGSSTGCRDGLGATIADDERGFFRSGSAGRCDIGAVEVGGGLTPVVGTVAVSSSTTNLATTIRLPNAEFEVEVLRVSLTAPTSQAIAVKSMTIRKETVESGVAGLYSSLRGIEVTVVDDQGREVGTPVFRAVGAQLPAFNSSGELPITFTSPVQLQNGQVGLISVRFIFDVSVVPLALGKSASMLAAASGLGLLSFIGLMGAGVSRRKALAIAAILLAASAIGGCTSGDDDEGDGSFDDGSRTFRVSARQIVFDTQATTNNTQSINVVGQTIAVLPP